LLPYIVSIASLVIATFAFFKEGKQDQNQLSKDEIINISDSISSSNQTKMVDSLRNSKNPTDSLTNE